MLPILIRIFLALTLVIGIAQAREAVQAPATQISVSALPREAQATLELIRRGGPFPYRRDGVVFQNRERRLPARADRYYHEYTVTTPGASDRGARRIIAGTVQDYYYTDDHYRSFKRIRIENQP